MSYKQTLYKIIEPVKRTTISRMNKGNKWKYGYDKEHDIVVISKTGKIGDIYEIQGLKIALPKAPKTVHANEDNKWRQIEKPKVLEKIKTIFDWRAYPEEQKEQWEGIMPALETAHALAYAEKLAAEMTPDQHIIVNLSGRGDKDILTVAEIDGIDLGAS